MGDLDFPTHLATDSARLRALLEPAEPTARVPSCPDWDVDDLLWHVTETQWFWGTIAADRLDSPKPAEASKPDRPADHAALLDLSERATERLLAALADLDDDTPVWSWNGAGDGAFVRRRQAHEVAIHRVDAQLVVGEEPDLDPGLADDGIDEALDQMFGLVPPWGEFVATEDQVMDVLATDTGGAWHVRLGRFVGTSPRTGRDYDRPVLSATRGTVDLATTRMLLTGSAADVDLWLWSRVGTTRLDVTGDDTTWSAFAHLVGEGVQ